MTDQILDDIVAACFPDPPEDDEEPDTFCLPPPVHVAIALALLAGYRNGQIMGDRNLRVLDLIRKLQERYGFRFPFTIPIRPMVLPAVSVSPGNEDEET